MGGPVPSVACRKPDPVACPIATQLPAGPFADEPYFAPSKYDLSSSKYDPLAPEYRSSFATFATTVGLLLQSSNKSPATTTNEQPVCSQSKPPSQPTTTKRDDDEWGLLS